MGFFSAHVHGGGGGQTRTLRTREILQFPGARLVTYRNPQAAIAGGVTALGMRYLSVSISREKGDWGTTDQ